jgi:hypothetical protein
MSEPQDAYIARLDERLASVIDRLDRIEIALREEHNSLRERVTNLEQQVGEIELWRAKTQGALTAMKVLWAVLGTAGGGVAALLVKLVGG